MAPAAEKAAAEDRAVMEDVALPTRLRIAEVKEPSSSSMLLTLPVYTPAAFDSNNDNEVASLLLCWVTFPETNNEVVPSVAPR